MDESSRRVPLSPDRYDARWTALAASGHDVHGEANLVARLLDDRRPHGSAAVLDAGCGTGRVAIELATLGFTTVGVDVDRELLDRARAKAPDLEWIEADLATLPTTVAPGPFDAAVAAGNVMVFLARGTEGAVLANLAARLAPGGFVVAGFQLSGRLTVAAYDDRAAAAGLTPVARWSTWDQVPFDGPDASQDYAVLVHRLADTSSRG